MRNSIFSIIQSVPSLCLERQLVPEFGMGNPYQLFCPLFHGFSRQNGGSVLSDDIFNHGTCQRYRRSLCEGRHNLGIFSVFVTDSTTTMDFPSGQSAAPEEKSAIPPMPEYCFPFRYSELALSQQIYLYGIINCCHPSVLRDNSGI